jgi:ligand-binding sensor domain-containing protein/tetratricopeptide (TPR) repeat protein
VIWYRRLVQVCLAVTLAALPVAAHNGAIAIAPSISGITIDGDLSDWPDGLQEHAISLVESGQQLKGKEDFASSFRVGYSAEEGALYLAIDVRDDSVAVDSVGTDWDSGDACEVYVDLGHGEGTHKQYVARVGDHGDGYEVAVERSAYGLVYEWKLIMDRAEQVQSIGLDVAIIDRDDTEDVSWVTWGKGELKWRRADRLGDIALLVDSLEVVRLRGQSTWEDGDRARARGLVAIRSTNHPNLHLHSTVDHDGEYDVDLPAGDYIVDVGYARSWQRLEVPALYESRELPPIHVPVSELGRRVPAGAGSRVRTGQGERRGSWHTLASHDGLAAGTITQIMQDRDGHIWMGTRDTGVLRYDGVRLTTYDQTDGLPSNAVESLYQSEDGDLWFGTGVPGETRTTGVVRYDGANFTIYDGVDGLDGIVLDLIQTQDKRMWIGTTAGLYVIDATGLRTIGSDFEVLSLFEDRSGTLWVVTGRGTSGNGAMLWRVEHDQIVPINVPLGDEARLAAIDQSSDGTYWLAEARGGLGLVTFDGTERWEIFDHPDLTDELRFSNDLLIDEEDAVWTTGWNGVYQLAADELTVWQTEQGLPTRRVNGLARDHQGGVWVATEAGLSRFSGDDFTQLSTPPINAVIPGPNGEMWIGTWGAGIHHYVDGRFAHYTTKDSSLHDDWIVSGTRDTDGSVLFGTGRGLLRAVGEKLSRDLSGTLVDTSEVAVYTGPGGAPWLLHSEGAFPHEDLQKDAEVEAILPTVPGVPLVGHRMFADPDGGMWLGPLWWTQATRSIQRYHEGRVVSHRLPGYGSGVTLPFVGWRERLLLGTTNGVLSFDGNRLNVLTVPGGPVVGTHIGGLASDRDGNLWIAGYNGVARFDGEKAKWFGVASGLAHSGAKHVVVGADNRVWLGTSNGLSVTDGVIFQTIQRRDGLLENDVYWLELGTDNSIWVGSSQGVTRYELPEEQAVPIYIDAVITDRRLAGPRVRIPSRSPQITVEYHGISYRTRPGGLLYRYRLAGHHDDWRLTREPEVTYPGLPIGEYTFEVEAIDLDLSRSEEPARVTIEVFSEPMSSVVRLDDIELDDIFPSLYKSYGQRPLGSVRVINDDNSPVEATVGVYIPTAMERRVEQTLTLPPHAEQVVDLDVVLSQTILSRIESAPVQAEISLSCKVGDQVLSVKRQHTITVHGRGALTWDETAKAAAFVTSDDPVVADFARALKAEHLDRLPDGKADGSLGAAMLAYAALDAHGIRYAEDASTPYSQIAQNRAAVDNIQYPAELLNSRQGDCDDLTVLYCSLLEALHVPTALVEAPDHIYLMFDAGIDASERLGFSLPPDRYIWRGERLWIPVEITKLGEGGFFDAWDLGARTTSKLKSEGRLRITDVGAAWNRYPNALSGIQDSTALPSTNEIAIRLRDSVERLRQARTDHILSRYVQPLLDNPANHRRRLELAKVRIETADYDEAISTLMPLVESPLRPEALFHIGYAYAGLGDVERALTYIELASEAAPLNRGWAHAVESLRVEAQAQ